MEPNEEAPRERQSKSRERAGYSWARITGLPSAVIQELDDLKRGVGFHYRDDVISTVLGEAGHLDPLIKAGLPQTLMEDEGGTSFNALMPDELIDVVTRASHLGPIPLDRRKVFAAILLAVRGTKGENFRALARRGLARKLESAA